MRSPRLLSFFLLSSGCYASHGRLDAAVAAVDTGVDDAAFAEACAAQLAHPEPTIVTARADAFLWRWSGVSCVLEHYVAARDRGRTVLPPQGCRGEDCGAIFTSEDACAAAHAVCGAEVERPRRGPAFARGPTDDTTCGALACSPETRCSFGVVPRCSPRSEGWHGAGLDCDDDEDCFGGTCCVTDVGSYVSTVCRTTACRDDEVRTCSGDADCGPTAFCCEAAAHQASVDTSIGACTRRPCDPESHVDI